MKSRFHSLTIAALLIRSALFIGSIFDIVIVVVSVVMVAIVTIIISTSLAWVPSVFFDLIGWREGLFNAAMLVDLVGANYQGISNLLVILPVWILISIKQSFFSPPTSIVSTVLAIAISFFGVLVFYSYSMSAALASGSVEDSGSIISQIQYYILPGEAISNGRFGMSIDIAYRSFVLSAMGLVVVTVVVLLLSIFKCIRLRAVGSGFRMSIVAAIHSFLSRAISISFLKNTVVFGIACLCWSIALSVDRIEIKEVVVVLDYIELIAVGLVDKNRGVSRTSQLIGFIDFYVALSLFAVIAMTIVSFGNLNLKRIFYFFIGIAFYLGSIRYATVEGELISWVCLGLAIWFGFVMPGIVLSRWIVSKFIEIMRRAVVDGICAKSRDRKPIILLRPFCLDSTNISKRKTLIERIVPMSRDVNTIEEVVASSCFRYAPIFAVGRPGDTMPPLGAIREYLDDGEWQPYVKEKVARSKHIVFIAGAATFTRWETQQILEADEVGRLIVVVPPDIKIATEYFEENPELCLRLGLTDMAKSKIRSGRVKCIVGLNTGSRVITSWFSTDFDYRLALEYGLSEQAVENLV